MRFRQALFFLALMCAVLLVVLHAQTEFGPIQGIANLMTVLDLLEAADEAVAL